MEGRAHPADLGESMNVHLLGRSAGPLFVALALLTVLLPGPAWSAKITPFTQWAAECNIPGLAYASPAPPDHANDGSSPIKVVSDVRGHNTPILMVHGWLGSSKHPGGDFSSIIDLTTSQTRPSKPTSSLIGILQGHPGAAVFTFDYHENAAKWVADERISKPLMKAIACLYERSHEKVIIVAHSMGGLATRQALSLGGRVLAAKVSQVIEFGTPNAGSLYAATVSGGLLHPGAGLFRAFLAYCGWITTESLDPGPLCTNPGLLPLPVTAFDSEAGRALRPGSAQMRDLPPFPVGMPVHSMAADIQYVLPGASYFAMSLGVGSVPGGDQVVNLDSAVKGATTTKNLQCAYELKLVHEDPLHVGVRALKVIASKRDPRELLLNFASHNSPCYHVNLMRTFELTAAALKYVAADIDARQGQVAEGTFRAGVTLYGTPSSHLVSVSLRLPPRWAANSNIPGFGDSAVRIVGPEGETQFDLAFREDLEGGCPYGGDGPFRLLDDAPVSVPGIDRAPPNMHSAIVSKLFTSRGPYFNLDYPVMLFVTLVGDEPNSRKDFGEDCPTNPYFKIGPVFGKMAAALGFNSEKEALAWLNSPKYWTLKDTMASLKVALVKTDNAPPTAPQVDWKNATYTITCDDIVKGGFNVTLRDGRATVADATGGYDFLDVRYKTSVSGDVTSDGKPETAVLFSCSPQPSKFFVEEVQVFTSDRQLLGEIPSPSSLTGVGDPLPPEYIPSELSMNGGELSAGMKFYAPTDSHASGPSEHRTIVWRWDARAKAFMKLR